MKNFTEMKFGDYTFMHNPKTLVVKNKLRGNGAFVPYHGTYFNPVALDNTTVTGEGLITGSDCFKKLLLLIDSLNSEKSRLLSISPFPSFKAILTGLEYTLTPKENSIEIKFEFTSSSSAQSGDTTVPSSYTAEADDTLWDIAYKYNIPVETLLSLNPIVKRPDILESGWVIKLW